MKLIKIIALLLCLSGCKSYQFTNYSGSKNVSEYNAFVKDFESNYIYLEDKKEIWDCIKRKYAPYAEKITSEGQHILFYEYLLNELYDNHIHLNVNTSASYRIEAPIYVVNKGNQTFIKNVWQTQLANPPSVNIVGAEILTMNDENFQNWIDNFHTVCQDKNDEKIREWIANKIIAGKRNEDRVLGLKLKSGAFFSLDMDSLILKEDKPVLSASIIPNENIGIIRINNSLGDINLVREFKKALNGMQTTRALIIDLRNTVDGGNTSVAKPLMGSFIETKKPYQLYENQKKKYMGFIKPKKPHYNMPLYILVNRWTGSMGEGMAIGLNSINKATIVGTEMARLAGGMKTINFKNHNYGFQVSFEKIFDINGNPREKFVPENYIEQTQTGKDEILEYTIEQINNSR